MTDSPIMVGKNPSFIDVHSQTWESIVTLINRDIDKLRVKLESTRRTHDETMVIRGEIRALHRVINLPNSEIVANN